MKSSIIPSFDHLPDSAMVRASQLVRNPKYPDRPTPLPFSLATLQRKIKSDPTFPRPVKLGERITAFRAGDIHAWLKARIGSTAPQMA